MPKILTACLATVEAVYQVTRDDKPGLLMEVTFHLPAENVTARFVLTPAQAEELMQGIQTGLHYIALDEAQRN